MSSTSGRNDYIVTGRLPTQLSSAEIDNDSDDDINYILALTGHVPIPREEELFSRQHLGRQIVPDNEVKVTEPSLTVIEQSTEANLVVVEEATVGIPLNDTDPFATTTASADLINLPVLAVTQTPQELLTTAKTEITATTQAPSTTTRRHQPVTTQVPSTITVTHKPLDIIATEISPDVIITEKPLDIVTTEKPLDILTTVKPLEQVKTELPINQVTTTEKLDVVATENQIDSIITEKPLNIITTMATTIEETPTKPQTLETPTKPPTLESAHPVGIQLPGLTGVQDPDNDSNLGSLLGPCDEVYSGDSFTLRSPKVADGVTGTIDCSFFIRRTSSQVCEVIMKRMTALN